MSVSSFYNKRKIRFITALVIIVLISGNIFYYRSLYNNQADYRSKLLDKQVQKAGALVDSINNSFLSDLNQIIFAEDISVFFSDREERDRIVERMKIFLSDYDDLATGIKLYDNKKNEFTLKRDETGKNWLEQIFVLHVQGEIASKELLKTDGRNYEYYLPVLYNNTPVGNLVVVINYQKFFGKAFSSFNLDEYQWQWVISDSSEIIYSNDINKLKYNHLQKIISGLDGTECGILIHRAEGSSKKMEVISSYYPVQLLYKKLAVVFSSPTEDFRVNIISSSIVMGLITLGAFLMLIAYFQWNLKLQKNEIDRLGTSEERLYKIIDDMPVGVIIHNNEREIIKANKKAADFYSVSDGSEMTGKKIPDITATDENNYFSKHLGGNFSPDQFVILNKESRDLILFRTSIPVRLSNENAGMEILVDVTSLESARKQEASASSAKSEFLSRISYEIRTPLNGIIGMIDLLERQNLPDESNDIVELLRRSAEVLSNIINDILDFSKIETGKIIPDEIPFRLREEILYCSDLARRSIDEALVAIDLKIDEDIPDNVIGDPCRLRQILTIFLNHSTGDTKKGQINIKCSMEKNSGEVVTLRFEISDTGRSYDKKALRKKYGEYTSQKLKIPDEIEQSDFTSIIARQLITLMGGEFSVVSPSGLNGDMGKRIVFTLNLFSNNKPVKNLHFSNLLTFIQLRTLVITGNNNRDEETLGILHKLGLSIMVTSYQRSTFAQIKTSLNFPENRYFLIIILDDKEFNGFDAAQEIWENNLSGQFKIILISSNDKNGNLLKCNKLGIDHYLLKPIEIKDLYDIIRSSFPDIDKAAPAGARENMRKDLRILVVDDNKMNQKVIGTMLKSLGYSFDFADDGFTALIQAKTRKYDVIFMDLIMPGMDGFESARKILEYDNKQIIVAFTADNLPDSKRKAELSGIMEFISKPVRLDDLKKLFSKYFLKN